MFSLTDQRLKIAASKVNQGGSSNLSKRMADLTWMRRHENIHQIETVHEINSQGKENHIIILPEEIKMPFAINHYIAQSNYYIEYLHWNNNGVLDRFFDHKNNMIMLNDE